MLSVIAAVTGLPTAMLVLAQTDPSLDIFSPKVLSVLGPFFGLLVALLWRSEKKRDEAEALNRQLYQAVIDRYEPTMTATKNETMLVLKEVMTELREARSDRQAKRPR